MLRVCYNGKRAYKSLKLSCSMKFWNEETSEVKSKHPYSINMNAIINQELSSLKALVLDYERTGTPYSAKILVEKISKPQLVTKTLLQLIDERVQYFKNEKGKYNTATGYRTLYNLVKKYVLRDIELFEVNRDWLKDFENFIRKTNKRETSIYKHFCTLKAVFNFAIKEGLLNEDKNPFKNFEQHLDRRTKKRALTFAEILKLMIYFQNKYSFVYPSDFEIHEGLILPPKNVKPIHTDDDEDIDVETIASYLDIFDRLFLTDNQKPYDSKLRSSVRVKQAEKRHLSDPSLAAALLKATPEMLLNDLNTLGFLFEALCERDMKIYAESFDAELYHYQDYNNNEMDAVISLTNGEWCGFEIKLGANQIDAAAQNLTRIRDEIRKDGGKEPAALCVVCGLSNAAYMRPDGVYVVPITALKN